MKKQILGIALLTVTVFTNAQAESEKAGVYQPKSPWPFAPFEDAAVGAGSTVAEFVTLGHADTGNAPTGLAVAVPDAIPGVSAARADKNSDSNTTSKRVKKQKSSSTRTRKQKN